MNTCMGKVEFKDFRILLYSGFISKILIISLITNLKTETVAVLHCHIQLGALFTYFI